MAYQRSIVEIIRNRIEEQRHFIQIIIGPRQTGKTTAVNQAVAQAGCPGVFAEATKGESTPDWIRAQWYRARNMFAALQLPVLLVIDEVQYIRGWSSVVKTLWDEDTRDGVQVKAILLGSSATLIHDGLSESLMGRFELIHSPHWSYAECADAFGYSLEDYLYFGGYPGAAILKDDERRWFNYMHSSIIDPSIVNDALQLADVRKPELMRRLFEVGAAYSGQEVSYRKLLGQLDDRGNAATIAHYLSLLSEAGLMSGLQKYDPKHLREKASSPRLIVHDTSLMVAEFGRNRSALLTDPALRGRLVESAVGAHLINRATIEGFSVHWWRDGNDEVDFVIADKDAVTAIEVKSGRVKPTKGMTRFLLENPQAHSIVVGSAECSIERFLLGETELFV